MALPTRHRSDDILAAIDVGTNAVRLELARLSADGALETLHQERDPVRPGEGLFRSGIIKREVADRVVATLRRYAAQCRRYRARVKAVGTSAIREARNRDDLVRRIKREAGLSLDVISGKEEARLICLGVLHGKPPLARSLLIDIGGGSTEVAFAFGENPKLLYSVNVGAVRLTEFFNATGKVPRKQLKLMRRFVREALAETLPERIPRCPPSALGSSGTIQAVVGFASSSSAGQASLKEIRRAVDRLADMDSEKKRKRFDSKRADIIVAGAVVLEAVMEHLGLESIAPVERGLREGILRDLVRRRRADVSDHSLRDAAINIGRRFDFGEAHALKVCGFVLTLFDDLAPIHQLPAAVRPLLECAAILHDIGQAVSRHRHHKHSQYLIMNADLPGLSDRERQMVALIARFHRRSVPDATHEAAADLTASELRTLRRAAALLRIADAFDCSHRQQVRAVSTAIVGRRIVVQLDSKGPLDLELWDAEHEAALFRDVIGRPIEFVVKKHVARSLRV